MQTTDQDKHFTTKQSAGRTVRLDKGYITRLKRIKNKSRNGGIRYIADQTGLHRTTITRVLETGQCLKSIKQKIQEFTDKELPEKPRRYK